MIKLDASIRPDFLDSKSISDAMDGIRSRVELHQSPVITKANEQLWRNEKITNELHRYHHGKCCYCERRRDRKSEMDVEHYRPKGKVDEDDDHSGYWWLVYDWTNLLWSCIACNRRYKISKFSSLEGSVPAYAENDNLAGEMPCLINPETEDPGHFIGFHVGNLGGRCFVKAIPQGGIDEGEEKRANETIRIVGLNRTEEGYDLVQERGNDFLGTTFDSIVMHIKTAEEAANKRPEHRQDYLDSIAELREELRCFIKSKRIFSGVYRDYLRQHRIEYESLLN